ncbi:helicase-related protein [Tessaracoccus oleiagri]|uniref:Helicase conserved C-terminal domain-containing protein n=1 Tax=Tessaracoccus oleiagri TaxID=686624 RepID=A0A1G9L548_9ACTN|nr:helicase-related protein [Tessaracoccus oleiagri]SDL57092.1 Helicase conserved C-terminal domain-containing protein [Tessaracoccus oleiagri]
MIEPRLFDAEPILNGLTGFQRNTVEHVIDRFYGDDPSDRFLVADETGLGKTIVARGVIARAVERLQRNDHVDRIDVVYVCSNLDLAHQNLRKLNVTGGDQLGIASRLTMLAKHSRDFVQSGSDGLAKSVNLVSFTPGTSFSSSWRSGKGEERAMLYLMLENKMRLRGSRADEALRVLQGTVSTAARFRSHYVEELRWQLTHGRDGISETPEDPDLPDCIDPRIARPFLGAAADDDLLDEFEELMGALRHGGSPYDASTLVGRMRNVLARESVRILKPDLVILDEFQRFRDLLTEETEAGELAHHLFNYNEEGSSHRAKVLLLSATPFRPFTYAEEVANGDEHHRDFLRIVHFLTGEDNSATGRIAASLRDYRHALVTGNASEEITREVRQRLLSVMERTERPRMLTDAMSREESSPLRPPPADDLFGYVALKRLARTVQAPFSMEYWKSAPYFVNFLDGYKLSDQVRNALVDPMQAETVRSALLNTQRINFQAMDAYEPIDLGNARMRALADDTIYRGWWKLLWVPPSLPYLEPGGPYAEDFARDMTKRLIFSSWMATPGAVSSLLSYEADRLGAGDAYVGTTDEERDRDRHNRRNLLAYRMDPDGDRERPSSMSTLALFWPMPGLASLGDPRRADLHRGSEPLSADRLRASIVYKLVSDHKTDVPDTPGPKASHWFEALRRADSSPEGVTISQVQEAASGFSAEEELDAQFGSEPVRQTSERRLRHFELALKVRLHPQDRAVTEEALSRMADVAAHSPGNAAYRALSRISADQPKVSEAGLWLAALRLSSAFRTLFSRPETSILIDQLVPDQIPYWRKILQYCAWGNLQAVLDEFVHHVHAAQGAMALDDAALKEIASMVANALELRPATYELFDPDEPAEQKRIRARFALRFGGRKAAEETNRQPLVRQAFNSPFWPFVLVTTSVGQEGVDFHWWCHAVMHWNTPPNPIDFEQREGRVDRFDGHAVRRNIASRHGRAILSSDDPNPWQVAYRLAGDEQERLGEFAPHWVYPGRARIERHVSPYPLSVDSVRLQSIKQDVALYRLTFGQPRQEDMLELLKMQYLTASQKELEALRLDLSAPPSAGRGGSTVSRSGEEPLQVGPKVEIDGVDVGVSVKFGTHDWSPEDT